MFIHNKTGQKFYSVREKINYYNKIVEGKISAPLWKVEKAKQRLAQLRALNERTFSEPTMIVTNDTHFGNSGAKPRAAVVLGTDKHGRLLSAPVIKNPSRRVPLEQNLDRIVEPNIKAIDRSDVYELKNISTLQNLSANDIRRIKNAYNLNIKK